MVAVKVVTLVVGARLVVVVVVAGVVVVEYGCDENCGGGEHRSASLRILRSHLFFAPSCCVDFFSFSSGNNFPFPLNSSPLWNPLCSTSV